MKCPCCGQEADLADLNALRWLELPPTEKRMLEFLLRRPGEEFNSDQVIDYIYAERDDGGPDTAANVASIMAYRLRKKLKPLGFTVKGRKMGPKWGGGTYKLERITDA